MTPKRRRRRWLVGAAGVAAGGLAARWLRRTDPAPSDDPRGGGRGSSPAPGEDRPSWVVTPPSGGPSPATDDVGFAVPTVASEGAQAARLPDLRSDAGVTFFGGAAPVPAEPGLAETSETGEPAASVGEPAASVTGPPDFFGVAGAAEPAGSDQVDAPAEVSAFAPPTTTTQRLDELDRIVPAARDLPSADPGPATTEPPEPPARRSRLRVIAVIIAIVAALVLAAVAVVVATDDDDPSGVSASAGRDDERDESTTTTRTATTRSTSTTDATGATGATGATALGGTPVTDASGAVVTTTTSDVVLSEHVALVDELYAGLTKAWEGGIDAGLAFVQARNYPGFDPRTAEQLRPCAFPQEVSNYREYWSHDPMQLVPDPLWTVPSGPLAGTVPAGYIYNALVTEVIKADGASDELYGPLPVHVVILGEIAYFFYNVPMC